MMGWRSGRPAHEGGDDAPSGGSRAGGADAPALAVLAAWAERAVAGAVPTWTAGRPGSPDADPDLVTAAVERLFRDAPLGFAVLDGDLRYVLVNDYLTRFAGRPVEEIIGRTVREIVPSMADAAEASFRGVLTTGVPLLELALTGDVPGDPGVVRHWRESVYPIGLRAEDPPDGGTASGLAVLVWEVTERVDAEQARARASALLDVLVGGAPVGIAFVDKALRLVRANRTLLSLEAEAGLPAGADAGTPADARSLVAALPAVGARLEGPVTTVLRTGRAVLDQEVTLAPGTASPGSTGGHDRPIHLRVSCYPVDGDVGEPEGVGVIVVDERERHETEALMAALLDAERAARQRAEAAQALAEQAHDRLNLLARASDVLSRSLDEDAVLDALGDLVVPRLADVAVVLRPDGGGLLLPARIRGAAGAADGIGAGAGPRLTGLPGDGDALAAQAFREQATRTVTGADAVRLTLGWWPDGEGWPRDLPETAVAVSAPMVVRGRSIGVLVLLRTGAATSPAAGLDLAAETELVGTLARRAAVALGNAWLFGEQSRIADRLQQSLLPQAIPAISGATLAVHYATAEDAVEVGGDFYDVVRLDGQRYVLVIGDVAGRGVDAAGLTGLARHTLRALAHDLPPAAMLTRLNEILVGQDHPDRFLTVVCALLELIDGEDDGDQAPDASRTHDAGPPWARLTVANAGHCRPLVVTPDGAGTFLEPTGPLLGVLPDARIGERGIDLHPGDALVLYTDGITETRQGRDLFGEEGLSRWLAARAESAHRAGTPAVEAADLVDSLIGAVDAFRAAPAGDDTALLILKAGKSLQDNGSDAESGYEPGDERSIR